MAENGEEALRTLHRTCTGPDASACPVLILLNMNMPVMNGLSFLAAYAQLPRWRANVVVMLTTSLHERDLARTQELPIASFISKLLTREKVTAILREHFPR